MGENGNILRDTIRQIKPADREAMERAWERWDSLCKPLRGLGRLEEMVVRLAGIQRTLVPSADRRAVVIMGADNGVVAEGVSQTGSEVTRQVLENMGKGISTVCVMSSMIRADVFPVDIGMDQKADHPAILDRAIRRSTGNIAKEPAMSPEDCIRTVEAGIAVARELREKGYDLVIAGEMGIGNTTTCTACACAFSGREPEELTGRGAGLSTEGLEKKISVIRKALEVNRPDPSDPLDVIAKVGGLDIAGMTGLYLGCASLGMAVLIDGAISGVAACAAKMLCPICGDYMFATHCSAEPAAKLIFGMLGLEPVLYADMHLGEGTGAAAFLPLLDQALNVYRQLPSFADSHVKAYEHLT